MSGTRIPGETRGAAITVIVDGAPVPAFAGETLATAMIAADRTAFRHDTRRVARGLFCNMGSCSECLVTRVADGRRIRACLTEAADGLEVRTDG
ncbi:(2Fe-2S)-binding protein [Sphingomonas colocasiae]|uniref:(2Fe-2S)-binding protein n=1 Tax=Sphingomonas colocasiae TaxID=1848973 RepID=A0ABS7PN25_9SPHN|nr:(2Fe-2S)-binding protein [Sphingomonas colocasiae]MBY8821444.1 (2Fe-2S)-binding protein [Sphingomonas colocasiae]